MPINEGESFVAGLDADTAKKLLAAAEAAGLDPSVVRADADGGFVVPAELVETTKKKPAAKSTPTKAAPAANKED
jgi:hypothetical protein